MEAVVVEEDFARRTRVRIRAQRRLVVAVRHGRRLVATRIGREAQRIRRIAPEERRLADDRVARKLRCVDVEPVPINCLAEAVRPLEREHCAAARSVPRDIVRQMEDILAEVLCRLDLDILCLDVQGIACDDRTAAAVDRRILEVCPLCKTLRRAVAEVDNIARRPARGGAGKTAVDIL